jgi:hypothetical protein
VNRKRDAFGSISTAARSWNSMAATSHPTPVRSLIVNWMTPLPEAVAHWSLTTLREKLIKIGVKVVRHGRHITFQMAEVAISRPLFAEFLRLINGPRPAPLPP